MYRLKTAIVILNWNGEKLLPQFLPSVIRHSQLPGTQIIVADNGSTDRSLEILSEQFPEVDILDLKQNHGFARGYNEALRQIEADYYVLLNSDVEVTEDWLEPVVHLLDSDPEIGAIQPKILSYSQRDTFEYAGAAGGFIDKYGFPFCRGRILNVIEKDRGQYDQPREIFWGSGACLFIRSELYHSVGGLDVDFWAHMEEIDLCWRIKNRGFKVVYCPDSTVYHLGGGSLPYNSPTKLYLNFRNNLCMLHKNLPEEKLYRKLVVRMLLDGVAGLKLLSEMNYKGFWSVPRAHYYFYKNLSFLRRKRRAEMASSNQQIHPEMSKRSIVWYFYIRRERFFSDLDL